MKEVPLLHKLYSEEFDNEEEVENNANITTLDNNTIIEDGNSNDITLQKKETASIVQTVIQR